MITNIELGLHLTIIYISQTSNEINVKETNFLTQQLKLSRKTAITKLNLADD